MSRARDRLLAERLRDERGGRVAFVSHCLLNENTRYLGGAFRPGGVAEVIGVLVDRGIGICQMPCPEQHAWGGVLKRRLLLAYGARGTPVYVLRGPLLRLFTLHTHLVYERLARDVARQVADYDRAGFTVVAVIGVGASPSCGVHTTLDVRHAFDAMARLSAATVDRRRVNRDVVLASRRAGRGDLHPLAAAPAAPPRARGPAARARPQSPRCAARLNGCWIERGTPDVRGRGRAPARPQGRRGGVSSRPTRS